MAEQDDVDAMLLGRRCRLLQRRAGRIRAAVLRAVCRYAGADRRDPRQPRRRPRRRRRIRLQAFMREHLRPAPKLPPRSAEFRAGHDDAAERVLDAHRELVTIIGLYSNVPCGGVIAGPAGMAQPASCGRADGRASSSRCITRRTRATRTTAAPRDGQGHRRGVHAAGRWPDCALRPCPRLPAFTRSPRADPSEGTTNIPYIVCGAGGYHNLHASRRTPRRVCRSRRTRRSSSATTQWGFLPADGHELRDRRRVHRRGRRR